MRRNLHLGSLCLAIVFLLAGAVVQGQSNGAPDKPAASPTAVGTAFQYQGMLNGYNGNYDFKFTIFDQPTGGARIVGSPVLYKSAVAVKNGYFTLPLDFGDLFSNTRLYLNIEVKTAGSTGSYTLIPTRQELLPSPQAYYALKARVVNWTGVSYKPAVLFKRRIWVPAAGWGYYSPGTNISVRQWGLLWKNSVETGGFVVPKPADWDPNTTFTVSIYFTLPVSNATKTVRWRLYAGGVLYNLPASSAATGWDSLNYRGTQDASPLTVYAASGHGNMMKVQTFTSKWSSYYHDWYFGASLSAADSYIDNPIWHFEFTRGAAAGNGETFTDDLKVVGAAIDYTAAKYD